jgi:tripartite ATP-independent transporter DctM subunit
MMETAGLWMIVAAALIMITTGLPTWIVLTGVALVFAAIGITSGAFTVALMTALPSRILGLLENDLLQALPLYVLIGALLHRLPLADILLRAGERVFACTGAATPLAGLGLGALLAPMNGSVGASVAMLARAIQPRLDARGVPSEQGAALVCVASTLGVVVPPSLVLILLGDAMLRAHTEAINATGVAVRVINTQDVFRGALLPAAILLALYLLVAWWQNKGTKVVSASELAATISEQPKPRDWLIAGATVLLIIVLLAGVTLGYLYAVEAAACGGVVLFAGGVLSRKLTLPVLHAVLRDTMAVTGALFALLLAATTFTLVLRAFGTDRWVANYLAGVGGGEYGVLIVVLLILGLCAFVLDAFEMIFVVIPVVLPPLLMRVPDATWVAVLMLLILQASFLVPPFGYSVMMVRNRIQKRLANRKLARALMPYLFAQLLVLALVFAIPAVVWHDHSSNSANGAPTPAKSDAELQEMMRRQLDQSQTE